MTISNQKVKDINWIFPKNLMIKGFDKNILAYNFWARKFLDIGFAQENTES